MLREFDIKKISDIALKKVTEIDIITPKIFEKTFLEVAQDLGFDSEAVLDGKVSDDLLENSILQLEAFDKQTRESFDSLKTTTSTASTAMVNNDQSALKQAQTDIQKLEQRLQELENDIHEDALTGAYNRKWLRDVLLNDQQFKVKGSMALVDLDTFKEVNDTYGHLVGDKVLSLICYLMKKLQTIENSIRIIRYGGDEFLLYCENQNLYFLETELEKIRAELKKKPVKTQGNSFNVSFSYGLIQIGIGESFEEVLAKVDELMYADKSKNRA
ncbi:MAG: GGDEF domain-containing protein [Fibrobacterales bacterium]